MIMPPPCFANFMPPVARTARARQAFSPPSARRTVACPGGKGPVHAAALGSAAEEAKAAVLGISSQLILGHAFVVPCARYVPDIQAPLLKKDRERIGGQGCRDSLRRFSNRPSRGRWSAGRFFPDSWLFPSLKAVETRIFRSAKTHCSAHNRQRVPSPNRRKKPGSPRSPPAGQPEAPPTHR